MNTIFLGTYTRKNSQGIYKVTLDDYLLKAELYAKVNNPTYLTFGESNDVIYTVMQEDNLAGIGKLVGGEIVNKMVDKANPPCFVSYQDQNIYSAYYHDSKVKIDGKSQEVINYSPGSKTHYVNHDPFNNWMWVCNLGTNSIDIYENNKHIHKVVFDGNPGPRHIAFLKKAKVAYVICELSNEVYIIDYNADILVKESYKFNVSDELNESAAIRLSNDDKYLYTSTRGDDFITVYKVNDEYSLTEIQTISTYGKHPRDFALSPDGRHLVVGNRDSDSLTLFSINEGLLTLKQKDVYVPEVVCVLFEGEK